MTSFEDYYEILQVSPSAEPEVIEAAYRKLAQKYHPDINKSPSASDKMRKINIAHDILGDPIKKRNYDTTRPQPKDHKTSPSDKRTPAKPKPLVKPSHIRFGNMEPGQRKTTSFVIDNIGGPYSTLSVSKPNSWLKVVRRHSLTTLKELPLAVKIQASCTNWGENSAEHIYVKLDDVKTDVIVEIRAKPKPLSDYEKIIAERTTELENDPYCPKAYFERGNAYSNNGDYDKALADFNKALDLDPKYAKAYQNRAITYSKKQNYDKAIVDFTKAIELNPKLQQAYSVRGVLYHIREQWDDALSDLAIAIALDPNDVKAYRIRASVYSNKGEDDKADADLKKASELVKDNFNLVEK